MDEARFGQQGTTSRVWALRGSRPRAIRQTSYKWTYLFAAISPKSGKTHEWLMPHVRIPHMNLFLEAFGRSLPPGVHAVVLLDQAGWHTSQKLRIPRNVTLLHLPPKSPELNPSELPWRECRQKYLSNREFKTEQALIAAVEDAWLRLSADPQTIRSLCGFDWLLSAVEN
jgi:transposase-like protein